ncbi:PRC-barrel domain-containing protein [Filomicrobium insigne]|uniref:PRC-barrel domain-containing protein n=2 Tax=Hyphomicrobiaceae TaxID=45401 RepID=A0A1H0UC21_9HYPH|nr:PRC-barrel domain-containing protein [Filomicrobium insigne]
MRYLAMTLSTILVTGLMGSSAFAQYPEPDTTPAQTQEQAPAAAPSEPAAAPAEEPAPTEPAEKAAEPAATPSEPAAAPAEEAAPSEPAEKAEDPAATPSEPAPAEAPAEKAETPPAAPALTASDVDGLNVVDSAGKELGRVVGVNEADGKVSSVEVETSGILGSGFFATTYVLPIDKISKDGDKLTASVTSKEAEQFKKK